MEKKQLIIICITIIICLTIISGTIILVTKNHKNSSKNNSTVNNTTLSNNTSTTKNSTSTTTQASKNKHYSYGDVVKSYTDSRGHKIVEYYGTGDDTPGTTTVDETTGDCIDEDIWV